MLTHNNWDMEGGGQNKESGDIQYHAAKMIHIVHGGKTNRDALSKHQRYHIKRKVTPLSQVNP